MCADCAVSCQPTGIWTDAVLAKSGQMNDHSEEWHSAGESLSRTVILSKTMLDCAGRRDGGMNTSKVPYSQGENGR